MKDGIEVPNALLRHALCSTNDGVVIADARAEDQKLIFVNPAFTGITGYRYDEAVGKNCRFLQGKERDQPELNRLRTALKEGTECRVILQNFRKNGELFWNELHIAPIYEDGILAYFVGVQSDVTARVNAEQQAESLRLTLDERNGELEALNEEKNRFVGMAAHDLRNPLNTISVTAQLLAMRAERDGQVVNAQFLEQIRESADFMSDLILDMLDVSKIEAGHMELQPESLELGELIQQTLHLQGHSASQKQIIIQYDETSGVRLTADRRKLLQVISNLLSNAIKYSPEGSAVFLELVAGNQTASLRITDQGCGIDPADQQRIFEPFGRIKKNRPTGGELSTGLGLFISRSIIEAHGGQLEVESETGKGSTFTMHLPFNTAESG
jgi:PAS domain S-box-containing protein